MKKEAIRVERDVRYDILTPEFLEYMAKIAHYGAVKYGDFNWTLSRLTGNKGPVNHMLKHIVSYQKNEPYDHSELGVGREWHLAAIAFNAMMEFYWSRKGCQGVSIPTSRSSFTGGTVLQVPITYQNQGVSVEKPRTPKNRIKRPVVASKVRKPKN